jgi:hypothetical protein
VHSPVSGKVLSGTYLRRVPPELETALRRAHAAERSAQGSLRVPAFRLTRSLLGGARLVGYPLHQLAECLGISVSSTRSRAISDGWITADTFADLTDRPRDLVDRWASDGWLPQISVDESGQTCYAASDLIRSLVRR